MESDDNFAPLRYEADPRPILQDHGLPIPEKPATQAAPLFSVPSDMKAPLPTPASQFQPRPVLPRTQKNFILAAILFLVLAVLAISVVAVWPPSDFPAGTTFSVPNDASLGQVADSLFSAGLIRSEPLFKAFVVIFSGERGVKAGDYLFADRQSLPQIAWRLVRGQEDLVPIKVTIPEGSDARQISAVLGKDIPGFSTATFLGEAAPLEGYLFPDTYFFNEKTTPDAAVQAMRSLFDQKISGLAGQIAASGRATSSVVIMASLLEREATSSADRRTIAGILWKRLDGHMPLDVDAALAYALGVNGSKLTTADLATTSPYNTYQNLGLPPTPIGNPGLSTIEDALDPTATDDWYYLSDSNGGIHYAATYDDQLANEAKYIPD